MHAVSKIQQQCERMGTGRYGTFNETSGSARAKTSTITITITALFAQLIDVNNFTGSPANQRLGTSDMSLTKSELAWRLPSVIAQLFTDLHCYRVLETKLLSSLQCMTVIISYILIFDVFLFSRKSVGVSHCICVWSALFHMLFLS